MNELSNIAPAGDFAREAAEATALLKAMANEPRLLILCHLAASGELGVGELVDRISISQSAISQHLARLRGERLVAARKDAQNVYYRLSDPRAERILTLLHEIFCPGLGQSPPPRPAGDHHA